MRILTTLVLSLWAVVAQAEETVLTLGENSSTLVQLVACRSENHALTIIGVQEREGFGAGMELLKMFARQRNDEGRVSCGLVQAYIQTVRLVYETTLDFPTHGTVNTVVVEIFAGGETFFALMPNVRIVSGDLA